MPATLEQFRRRLADIRAATGRVHGFLTDREMEALAALAAYPKARGDILEIGSLRGKSAIVLAMSAQLADEEYGRATVAAVDPLPDIAPMAPGRDGTPSAEALFRANLAAAGVEDRVEIHKMRSDELAPTWRRRLRLAWIDGAHTYPAVLSDFTNYAPHLVEGGVIAFHDVLHAKYDGPVRVFAEMVLSDDRYWPAKMCGSIGWARFNPSAVIPDGERASKERLALRLRQLFPFQQREVQLSGVQRLAYRWRRMTVPHRGFDVAAWRSLTA